VIGVQRIGLLEGAARVVLAPEALEHQAEVVDRVRRLGIHRDRALEMLLGLLEASQLEAELALEGSVDRDLAGLLDGASHQELCALEVVDVKQRLRLQVVDLGLGPAIGLRQLGRSRQQPVAQRDRLLVLAHLLDQQLRAVQVGGQELRVGHHRELELVERLLDAALVPEDLAAAVVRLGSVRVRLQRLVEPGQRLVRAAAVGRFHRLVQAIPVAVVVSHARRLAALRLGLGHARLAEVRAP
jgi:hypothetical protein